ncbi:MAG: hypothetical protein WB998_06065 [Solirubrobacteraceae bacterium]
MTRTARAWGALAPEQRIAAVAAIALLVTMFLPWYELQSLDRKTGAINSSSISAFGDVSFVEAAVFLVAAGVIALLFARAERKDFHMPGSDGAIVMVAGGWATLLIFYRVFSRPAGHGYPVGIQWGFFLAFVASGALTYAGWRMRATSTPETPRRVRVRRTPRGEDITVHREDTTVLEEDNTTVLGEDVTVPTPSPRRQQRAAPVPARPGQARLETEPGPTHSDQAPARTPDPHPSPGAPVTGTPGQPAAAESRSTSAPKRPRFPPKPSEQLSFEDQPPSGDGPYHSPDDAP